MRCITQSLAALPAHALEGVHRTPSSACSRYIGGQNGHDPVLEFAVVAVGHNHVADAIEALLPQGLAFVGEVSQGKLALGTAQYSPTGKVDALP